MRKYDLTSEEELHKLREEMSAELAALTPAEREDYWAAKARPVLRKVKNRRVHAGSSRLRKTV